MLSGIFSSRTFLTPVPGFASAMTKAFYVTRVFALAEHWIYMKPNITLSTVIIVVAINKALLLLLLLLLLLILLLQIKCKYTAHLN